MAAGLVAVFALALVVVPSSPSAADNWDPSDSGTSVHPVVTPGQGGYDARIDLSKPGSKQPGKPGYSGPPIRYSYVPPCVGNSPGGNTDTLCSAATALCPAGGTFMNVYRQVGDGPWGFVDQGCFGVPVVGGPAMSISALVASYFGHMTLPAPRIRKAPDREGLVGLETYFWLDSPPRPILVIGPEGLPLILRASVVSYRWEFGDGETLTTTSTGSAYPSRSLIAHTYQTMGRYTVRCTAVWGATYDLRGGPTGVAVSGRVSTGSAVAYPVAESRGVITD
ncbi:MAG: PKD domain-containing protein [Actinomycetota bacterium]